MSCVFVQMANKLFDLVVIMTSMADSTSRKTTQWNYEAILAAIVGQLGRQVLEPPPSMSHCIWRTPPHRLSLVSAEHQSFQGVPYPAQPKGRVPPNIYCCAPRVPAERIGVGLLRPGRICCHTPPGGMTSLGNTKHTPQNQDLLFHSPALLVPGCFDCSFTATCISRGIFGSRCELEHQNLSQWTPWHP